MENGLNKGMINIHVDLENGTQNCLQLMAHIERKCALILHSCISVKDRVQIKEQNIR